MKMRAYKGSDDIQQINQWEATRKMMLDEDIARRNDSLHHNEKELRERCVAVFPVQSLCSRAGATSPSQLSDHLSFSSAKQ